MKIGLNISLHDRKSIFLAQKKTGPPLRVRIFVLGKKNLKQKTNNVL
jgi:hypothetical protein